MNKINQDENLSVNIQKYFSLLNKQVEKIYSIASKAREKGLDPSLDVEIPIAKDIADRVEGLIGPKGVGERIRDFEKRGLSREMVAFKIAEEICDGKLMQGSTNILADQALRTSLAVITESITAAPLEGIARIAIKTNDDGSDYLAVYYAGPIRSAGGTAAGMSVLLADFIRKKLGLDSYKPIAREIERYVEEMELYNRVSHLQLPTTQEEQRFAAENLPVEITGEPTDKVEVSGNRDLRRIETNRLRGGACLVFNDGLVGRAKKIHRRVIENKLEGWDWLEELISLHEKAGTAYEEIDDKYETEEEIGFEETEESLDNDNFDEFKEELIEIEEEEPEEILTDMGYIMDVIAGRPVFAHPSRKGGFRIRYGRSRTTGLAGMGIHPALMGLVDDFLACGTHLRTERPGKGAIVMPVDTIHPPIVRLLNGDVIKVNTYQQAKNLKKSLSEILFLGDMLYGVGEFNQNNYHLIPAGYCEEWWIQELEVAYSELLTKEQNVLTNTLEKKLKQFFKNPYKKIPSGEEAIKLSKLFNINLHPEYTYHWANISMEQYIKLREYVAKEKFKHGKGLEIPYNKEVKTILEDILVPHKMRDDKLLFGEHSFPILHMLGIKDGKLIPFKNGNGKVRDIINQICDVKIRDKSPTYTGARMGRPEKAKDRRMRPAVHMLFPIGEAGGRMRDLLKASEKNNITVELTARKCPSGYYTHRILCNECRVCSQCGDYFHSKICPKCSSEDNSVETKNKPASTVLEKQCPYCEIKSNENLCPQCGKRTILYKKTSYPINKRIREIKNKVGLGFPQKIKAVKKLMNMHRSPELLEKGILRAKHGVFVYRDGTIRFDSTDAVLTHFKPEEIGASIQKLREIGYNADVHGTILEKQEQLVELKIQDIVLNKAGGKHLVKTAKFVDELLEKVYGLPRYYNATKPEDLIGHIVMGLAPHTSAGIVGRIIGFTRAKVNLAHPYWHAAKRRNCIIGSEEIQIWDTTKQTLILKPIGEVVEELISKAAHTEVIDDFGTLKIENLYPNWKVFSIDENTKKPILQPIKHWIKGESDTWIEIRTETGRTLKVTPNHNMLVWNKETKTLTKTKAKLIQSGDYIPIVKHPPIPTINPPSRINILEEFSKNLPKTKKFEVFKQQIRLRNAKRWIKEKIRVYVYHKLGLMKNPSGRLSPSVRKKLIDILPRVPLKDVLDYDWFNSIPLNHLEVLHKRGVFEWDDIPDNAVLGIARDDYTVEPYIEFSTNFMRLIGYLVAEGYICDERTCYQTNFSVPNPDLRKHVEKLIAECLGSEPHYKKENNQLVHTGRIHAYLFAYAFEMGGNAYEKTIPSFVFSLPSDYKLSLLSAIIDGAGSIPKTDASIQIYSVSKKFLNHISILLLSLGIFSKRCKPSPLGHYDKEILPSYRKLGKTPEELIFHRISIRGPDLRILNQLVLFHETKKKNAIEIIETEMSDKRIIRVKNGYYTEIKEDECLILDSICDVKIESNSLPSYCLEIKPKENSSVFHNFATTGLLTMNCDGDEDSIILALDAFLNFSRFYLPEIRGGQMDAPLILVANLNPEEVDDESHNVDTSSKYPLSFYESTLKMDSPGVVLPLIDTISNRLADESAYEGFLFSHDTARIFDGPSSTAYKKLKTMEDKVLAQLEVANKIKAVDTQDVAYRIVVNHFIPDLIGNLRKFGAQKIRCTKCNRTYRRIPLLGICPNCKKPNLNLTVHVKSVKKYFEMAHELVEKYDLPTYLKNRLEIIKHNFDSLFGIGHDENEKKAKTTVTLSDFMVKKDPEA